MDGSGATLREGATGTPGETAGPPEKRKHCRTNSRRGLTDPADRSYPPVSAVCRALGILREVNRQGIATVNSLYGKTGIPRPTIVRMLETLIYEGYVVRDNMCGGYRVTKRVADLSEGYSGINRVIEVARPLAIRLTQQIKWPIGLGVLDDDAIEIQYWTGTISPWAHTNTVLGIRPDLLTTAMGRAWLAYCDTAELEHYLARFRADPDRDFDEVEEEVFRALLRRVRRRGYASRDPRVEPKRMTTFGVPLMENGRVEAVMSVSFYTSAIPHSDLKRKILAPLIETRASIEDALSFMSNQPALDENSRRSYEVSF